jgi:hypothetical protein
LSLFSARWPSAPVAVCQTRRCNGAPSGQITPPLSALLLPPTPSPFPLPPTPSPLLLLPTPSVLLPLPTRSSPPSPPLLVGYRLVLSYSISTSHSCFIACVFCFPICISKTSGSTPQHYSCFLLPVR